MRKNIKVSFLTFLHAVMLFMMSGQVKSQNVAISDDDSYIVESSAMLDVKSLTKGMLIPRMTSTERENIIFPATGLMVFQTNLTTGFYFFNGSEWKLIGEPIAETDPVFSGNFDFTGAATNDLLQFNGTKWIKLTPDFSFTNHIHSDATISVSGFMSPAEKIKLDGLQNADGSETKVTAGTNVEVTGVGSTASPFVISTTSPVYLIGNYPELGGYVFYVTPDSKHGLVAESQDQSTSCPWYYAQSFISDPVTHSLVGKNFTDWRLPTYYELNILYGYKSSVGGFTNNNYWSSESSYNFAYCQSFLDGTKNARDKSTSYYVRAIRAF